MSFHTETKCVILSDRSDESTAEVYICSSCSSSIFASKIPKYCIASGYDFGNLKQLNLPKLSLSEEVLISKNVQYKYGPNTYKISRDDF